MVLIQRWNRWQQKFPSTSKPRGQKPFSYMEAWRRWSVQNVVIYRTLTVHFLKGQSLHRARNARKLMLYEWREVFEVTELADYDREWFCTMNSILTKKLLEQ
jgi:hypothetical protein